MNDNSEMRIKQLTISSLYVMISCVLLTIFTSYLFLIYCTVHNQLLNQSYALKAYIYNVSNDKSTNQISSENVAMEKHIKVLLNISENIVSTERKLLSKCELYRIFGLSSFALSIITFFCRPRPVGIIALPFGLFSLFISIITI